MAEIFPNHDCGTKFLAVSTEKGGLGGGVGGERVGGGEDMEEEQEEVEGEEGGRGGGGGGGEAGSLAGALVSMSCQPHRVTSVRPNIVTHKQTHISKLFS